ncbi:hypothetical protein FB451DRAFT_1179274 [Mycena latifolia]|nr:hypothetical protein FB451DRAFT_1179274 [Mycena latifolia]
MKCSPESGYEEMEVFEPNKSGDSDIETIRDYAPWKHAIEFGGHDICALHESVYAGLRKNVTHGDFGELGPSWDHGMRSRVAWRVSRLSWRRREAIKRVDQLGWTTPKWLGGCWEGGRQIPNDPQTARQGQISYSGILSIYGEHHEWGGRDVEEGHILKVRQPAAYAACLIPVLIRADGPEIPKPILSPILKPLLCVTLHPYTPVQ